ncbi:MAG: helix-turn-helix domain-containing protein [Anaerolineae bacterium]
MPQVRVALLVPDRITRSGIEGLMKHDGTSSYNVVVCANFEALLNQSSGIDILLMDISGLRMREVEERFAQLTKAPRALKVIIISNRLAVIFIHRIMQLGAKGFIYRDDLAEALLNGLDLVRRDMNALSFQAAQMLTMNKYLYRLNEIKALDMQVLRLTAKGLTVKEIAAELDVSTRSIYRARDKLRAILNAPTTETLIKAAQEQGLLDLEDD